MMAQSVTQSIDCEIISTLKINNKGWNIQLFEDQNKLSGYICTKCKSICCDAVELGCNHNDNDVFLYCDVCLKHLVIANDNKCPIDGHLNPIIIPTRTSRRQIYKSMVFCPYSQTFKAAINNNDDEIIIDTLGGDEKEGVENENNYKISLNKTGCIWKGTLNDLINGHITECTKKNNPSFTLNTKIKDLEHENNELNKRNMSLETEIDSQRIQIEEFKNEIGDKNEIINGQQNKINQLQQENEELKVQLNEQFILMQDVMKNIGNKCMDDEKKNDNNDNALLSQQKQSKLFEFIIPKSNEHKLTKSGYNKIKKSAGFSLSHYWSMFGPLLKKNDNVTVQFEMKKSGFGTRWQFGFATDKFKQFDVIYPDHVCFVNALSEMYVMNEFAEINDINEIEKILKDVKFYLDGKSIIIVNIHVDMTNNKGCIWAHDDKEHVVEFNLPKQVYIVVGLGGNEEKIVTAKNVTVQ